MLKYFTCVFFSLLFLQFSCFFLIVVTCPLPEVFSAELFSTSGKCNAGSSIDFETTCIFECSIGYTVIGAEDVTCQSDGELSAPIPTCAGKSVDVFLLDFVMMLGSRKIYLVSFIVGICNIY